MVKQKILFRRLLIVNKTIYLAGAMSCYFNTDQHDYPKKWREDAKKYGNLCY